MYIAYLSNVKHLKIPFMSVLPDEGSEILDPNVTDFHFIIY